MCMMTYEYVRPVLACVVQYLKCKHTKPFILNTGDTGQMCADMKAAKIDCSKRSKVICQETISGAVRLGDAAEHDIRARRPRSDVERINVDTTRSGMFL
jgi:hypothetical protein